jgi:two-component system NtrC family response regulator
MPGGSGLDLLEAVRHFSHFPVIVITAFGSIETAVDAMKRGATDFITKPFNREELFESIERCQKLIEQQKDAPVPAEVAPNKRKLLKQEGARRELIGESAAMLQIKQTIKKLAQSDVSVLITGESGTGKEVVAQAVHFASPRASTGQYVALNSSAIPRDLLESELFGHVKGSFTGAVNDREGKFVQANGGTLFLDEIGDMPVELQAKLLRALQEREIEKIGGDGRPQKVDVRVVAATNRDLSKMVEEGGFREDLLYRLNVVTLKIPPLRNRAEDIDDLVAHFMSKYAGEEPPKLDGEALEMMKSYHWPGNVRELENVIQRALALRAEDDNISIDDLPEQMRHPSFGKLDSIFTIPSTGIVLDEVEAKLIRSALTQTQGNQTRAAELLGITRQTLIYRLQKYDISKEEFEGASANVAE